MTTSGTYTFSLTKANIIKRAFQYLNIYDLADTVSDNDSSFASDMLNLIIKSWEAEGMRTWKRRQAYIFPALGTYKYDLGSVAGAEHCTNSYVDTTVVSASGTSITVNSTIGMTAADYIGIELNDGTRFWTTIDSIVGSVVTTNDPITSDAAAGNTVIAYTNKINRPLEIVSAVNIDISNNSLTTTIGESSHDEFFKTPLKSTAGAPCRYYYDKLIDGVIPHTAPLYVYPAPDNVNRIISIRYLDSIQDMLNNNDDPDFPQEWSLALVMALAEILCVPYGRTQELQVVQMQAEKAKSKMDFFDADMDPLKFKPKR